MTLGSWEIPVVFGVYYDSEVLLSSGSHLYTFIVEILSGLSSETMDTLYQNYYLSGREGLCAGNPLISWRSLDSRRQSPTTKCN